MNTDELLQTIQKALKEDRNLTLNDSVDTISKWDSMGHLAILVAIDKELDGKAAEIKSLADCQSTKAIADLLKVNNLLEAS